MYGTVIPVDHVQRFQSKHRSLKSCWKRLTVHGPWSAPAVQRIWGEWGLGPLSSPMVRQTCWTFSVRGSGSGRLAAERPRAASFPSPRAGLPPMSPHDRPRAGLPRFAKQSGRGGMRYEQMKWAAGRAYSSPAVWLSECYAPVHRSQGNSVAEGNTGRPEEREQSKE